MNYYLSKNLSLINVYKVQWLIYECGSGYLQLSDTVHMLFYYPGDHHCYLLTKLIYLSYIQAVYSNDC